MNNKSGVVLFFALIFLSLFLQSASAAATAIGNTPPTNTIIDFGQNTVLSIVINPATYSNLGPFTGNWVWTSPQGAAASTPTNTFWSNILSGSSLTSYLAINALTTTASNEVIFTFNNPSTFPTNVYTVNMVTIGVNIIGRWLFSATINDFYYNGITLFGNVVINPAQNANVLMESNTVVDAGQYTTLTANPAGGTSPYAFNYFTGMGCVPTNIIPGGAGATAANFVLSTYNTFSYNSLDSATSGNVVCSNAVASNSVIIYTAPSVTITAINAVLDQGQYATFSTSPTGGSGTVTTYSFNAYNSVTIGTFLGNQIGAATTYAYLTNALWVTNSPIKANVMVKDVGTGPGTLTTPYNFNSVNSIAVTIFSTPAITITAINAVLDQGQYATFSTSPTGGSGTAPTTYSFNAFNSVTIGTFLGNQIGAATTYAYLTNALWVTNSPIEVNVLVKDIGAGVNTLSTPYNFNSVNSIAVTVNPPQLVHLLTETNTVIDIGQYSTLTAAVTTGGTSPYTYNWFLGGTCSGVSQGTGTTLSVHPVSTQIYSFNSADSATTKNVICSISNTITVSASSPVLTLNSIASIGGGTVTNSMVYGNTVTVNALVTGGSGPFSFQWTLNYAGVANTAIGTTGSSYVFLPAVLAGNYVFNVIATDLGTWPVNYILPQATNTIGIIQNTSLSGATATYTRSASGGTTSTQISTSASVSAGYYDVASISFSGVNTLNSEAPWYVNGALASAASPFSFGEQANPGTYTFAISDLGTGNYAAYNFIITLGVSQPSGGGSTGVGYTTTVTTTVATTSTTVPVTTTISYNTANVTVPANSSAVVNSSPGMPASIILYTSSTGGTAVRVTESNATTNSPAAPLGYTKLIAVNITLSTTANITANVTLPYLCSLPAASIAPYILKNSTWKAIIPFTVNSGACTVTFAVPKDPILGLMLYNYVQTTVTTMPTTAPTTISGTAPQSGLSNGTMIAAAVVIIIIIIAAYALMRNSRKGKWPRR